MKKITAIIFIICIVVAIFISLILDYKNSNDNNSDSDENVKLITESYNLDEQKEENNVKLIEGIEEYKNDYYHIFINSNKQLEINMLDEDKKLIIEEIKNVKKFIYSSGFIVLTDDGKVYTFYNLIEEYGTKNDVGNIIKFEEVYARKNGIYISDNNKKFINIYTYDRKIKNIPFDTKEIKTIYGGGAYLLQDENNIYYELAEGSYYDIESYRYKFETLEDLYKEFNYISNFYYSENTFAFILENGKLLFYQGLEELTNKFNLPNDDNYINKMFLVEEKGIYKLYVITSNNNLMLAELKDKTEEELINFSLVKNTSIETITYTVPENYKEKLNIDSLVHIKNLKMKFKDNSEIVFPEITNYNSFNIIKES